MQDLFSLNGKVATVIGGGVLGGENARDLTSAFVRWFSPITQRTVHLFSATSRCYRGAKVSQAAIPPDSNPRLNHSVRCAEVPCVKLSGLT